VTKEEWLGENKPGRTTDSPSTSEDRWY